MSVLTNKTIVILSPQSWGNMFISKHHYAIALAEKGNRVYFINPPDDPRPAEKFDVKPSGVNDNLFIVSHRISFPYRLKFHALPVFHWFMRGHIKSLLKKLEPPDIIWSFDIGYFYPFRYFPDRSLKVFHPVDEPLAQMAIDAANGADIILSVTEEILEKYKHLQAPRYFINHGLATAFLDDDIPGSSSKEGTLKVGFSGNLLRNDIDKPTFLRIVKENPGVYFECWGSYQLGDSNIGGNSCEEQRAFVEQLAASKNVILHGPVPVKRLAAELKRMDAFLVCYDIKKDQSKGTNYHKIMEYLSTGKVIVSNNVTTYKNRNDLVQMIPNRESNDELPVLFGKVIMDIQKYNSQAAIEQRRRFAADNTYYKQLERIGQHIERLK